MFGTSTYGAGRCGAINTVRVALPNGVALEVRLCGPSDGEPLLLLHGVTDSSRSMAPLMERLPPGIRAIAVSLRGHGASSLPARFAYEDFVEDLLLLMRALDISAAHVLGHSMGALVAQKLARAAPGQVSSLTLAGGMPGLKGNAAATAFHDAEVADLSDPIDPAFVRSFQESTLTRPVPEPFLDLVVEESLKAPARVWRAAFQTMLAERFDGWLGEIACPTLLIWGDQDGFVPRSDQDRLLAGLQQARLEVLTGAGHAPHWEEPERVAGLLANFLRNPAALAA